MTLGRAKPPAATGRHTGQTAPKWFETVDRQVNVGAIAESNHFGRLKNSRWSVSRSGIDAGTAIIGVSLDRRPLEFVSLDGSVGRGMSPA